MMRACLFIGVLPLLFPTADIIMSIYTPSRLLERHAPLRHLTRGAEQPEAARGSN
jgi:hypothetical protein